MNILITGGLGYIGSWLARKLSEEHDVTIVDNTSTHELKTYDKARKPLERKGVEIIIDDARNLNSDILRGTDMVFHFAAVSGVQACENDAHGARLINQKLTNQILEACRDAKVKRLIFASTAAVYGSAQECTETTETIPQNRYAKTKLRAEQLIKDDDNVDVIIARFSNVYGMGYYDKPTVVSKFVRAALKNEALKLYGSGEQVRDLVHLKDVVKALTLLMSASPGVYNVGSGRTVGMRKLAERIVKWTRSKSVIVHEETKRVEPMPGYKYDISKLKEETKYKPSLTLKKGVVQLADGVIP